MHSRHHSWEAPKCRVASRSWSVRGAGLKIQRQQRRAAGGSPSYSSFKTQTSGLPHLTAGREREPQRRQLSPTGGGARLPPDKRGAPRALIKRRPAGRDRGEGSRGRRLRRQLRRLFQREETHDRNKMSHHDNQYQYYDSHGSDRHQEERRAKKPHPSKGRSTQGTPGNQHSRPSTAYSDQYQKSIASTHEYVSYPPHLNPQKETFSEKCNKLCTRRGVLKFVEITVNILVLICVGASHAAIAGYSSMSGLGMGSFNIGSFYSPFEGSEFQEVRDLDMQYSQMRAPCVYGGVAFSLTLTTLTLLFLIVGAKPIHRVSVRMLVAECVFDALACMGYIVAVGLYLHFIIQVNSTDTCKKRERLYARRGYTWMNCEVQGGDAAVSLFGIIAACLYIASSVVCALAIRTVQAFRRQMTRTQYSPENSYREHQKNYRSPESIHNTQTIATLV